MQISKNETIIIQKETRAATIFSHIVAQHMNIQFTDIRCLNYLMDNSQGFRKYVLQALVERLTDVISLISDITFRRLELRLACLMGQQFERSGGMPLRITHAELACELGTTREVISRILKDFERQQCISLNRGQIHLVSQDGLEWFGSDRKTG